MVGKLPGGAPPKHPTRCGLSHARRLGEGPDAARWAAKAHGRQSERHRLNACTCRCPSCSLWVEHLHLQAEGHRVEKLQRIRTTLCVPVPYLSHCAAAAPGMVVTMRRAPQWRAPAQWSAAEGRPGSPSATVLEARPTAPDAAVSGSAGLCAAWLACPSDCPAACCMAACMVMRRACCWWCCCCWACMACTLCSATQLSGKPGRGPPKARDPSP